MCVCCLNFVWFLCVVFTLLLAALELFPDCSLQHSQLAPFKRFSQRKDCLSDMKLSAGILLKYGHKPEPEVCPLVAEC